ncbi:MAG: AAA family ATPase, partial [Gammaproteobacteria bacterium]|nr:AAA family ATPase [Gammaproteobacteria bacterium]
GDLVPGNPAGIRRNLSNEKPSFEGTRDNQLFLTNSVSQKVDIFKPVYDWFRDALVLIAPDSRFGAFERSVDDRPLYEKMKEILPQLDTGISHLELEEVPFNAVPFPEEIKDQLEEEVSEDKDMKIRVHSPRTPSYFIISRQDGELVAKKLVAFHPRSDGTEVKFDLHKESDGSQRVIDLLPAFLELSTTGAKRVFVIDEVDRSLHSLLLRQLLETYLESCSTQSRAQLLITTHDVFLMDQDLFRRDEMWVTERNAEGMSDLFSFSEYKDIRYDKNIRNSYLDGRLGGIPRMGVGR